MSTLAATEIKLPAREAVEVPLRQVDAELMRQFKAARTDDLEPMQLVRMSNLIIYCGNAEQISQAESVVPSIVDNHPARVLLLHADHDGPTKEIRASVLVRPVDSGRPLVSELVILRAGGGAVSTLPFAVRSLLIGDLPTNLWWASTTPPPKAGPILDALAEHAEQVLFDSLGWADPNRAIAGLSTWLGKFERDPSQGPWRIASDVNWRRLKFWRRLLSQALDPVSSPGILPNISEVLIEHGPQGVTQAWEIASWLASRLGWTYQTSKLQPNVEIAFQFRTQNQKSVSLRIDRLAEGPSEICRIRMSAGNLGTLEFACENGNRLSVMPQGVEVAVSARTVTLQKQTIGELVARQLSDREPDSIFRESLKVAQQLAKHVVG